MFKLLLIASVDICDLYLFHSISLVNPDFKLVNNLISSSLDKVTTGIYNLQSVILSFAHVGALSLATLGIGTSNLFSKLVIMQFLSHFNSKDTSQLINGMFNALQKLPKYFNGIANSNVCLPFLFVRIIVRITSYFIFILKSIRINYINVSKVIITYIIT